MEQDMHANEIIRKYNLEGNTWTPKGFHGVLHSFFPVGEEQILPLKKHFGLGHTMTIFFVKNDYVTWYWNDASMTLIREAFIHRVNKNPLFIEQWLALWKRLLKKFVTAYKACDVDLSKCTDKQLFLLY